MTRLATALSPRQREALALAAEGWSDREIGARLGCAHITAQKHVSDAIRRLGCCSRMEAVQAAAGVQLAPLIRGAAGNPGTGHPVAPGDRTPVAPREGGES